MSEEVKHCGTCGSRKDFSVTREKKWLCLPCKRNHRRKWKARNADRVREQNRRDSAMRYIRIKNDPKRRSKFQKARQEYYRKNRKRINALAKKWRRLNHHILRIRSKVRYINLSPDAKAQIVKRVQLWKNTNRNSARRLARRYYLANKPTYRMKRRIRRAITKEHHAQKNRNRLAAHRSRLHDNYIRLLLRRQDHLAAPTPEDISRKRASISLKRAGAKLRTLTSLQQLSKQLDQQKDNNEDNDK